MAKTKEVSGGNTSYFHRLHALDLTTGAEKFGGPVVIASVGARHRQWLGRRPGAVHLLAREPAARTAPAQRRRLRRASAAHGDQLPYHGWVIGYNASNLSRVMVFCTSPNDSGVNDVGGGNGSGIWQSGDGPASRQPPATSTSSPATATFDVNTGGNDYGDSLLEDQPGRRRARLLHPPRPAGK